MVTALEEQIEKARTEISADTISMSITELTNLYKEGVLQIRPEFQRLYRWSEEQKSRLVESVLLGIPLPSLFVSQSEEGIWELVDGLQRVSTLLELQGVLRKPEGELMPALTLRATKYLPNLEGRSWNGDGLEHEEGDDDMALSEAQKLDIRLARLDLKVIKRSSDPKAKFDLFQRLNSFGTTLEPQEIRSAMIAGTNSKALSWIAGLANDDNFATCVPISDRLKDQQYDIELVLRFLMLHNRDVVNRAGLQDFPTRLNDWSVDLASEPDRWPSLEATFLKTFKILAENGGENVLRKWDRNKSEFRGSFLNTSFEVLALGLGFHVASGTPHRTDMLAAARQLWELPEFTERFATGLATADRFVKTIPLGRRLTADPVQQPLVTE